MRRPIVFTGLAIPALVFVGVTGGWQGALFLGAFLVLLVAGISAVEWLGGRWSSNEVKRAIDRTTFETEERARTRTSLPDLEDGGPDGRIRGRPAERIRH